jgi:hypothetical protein
MTDLLSDHVSDSLPRWIIERAAIYMLSRYGRTAMMRATARHRELLDQGEHKAAADWLRVSEEIERRGIAQIAWPLRRRVVWPDAPRSSD